MIQRALDGDTTPAAKKTGSEENLQAVSENAAGAEQTTSVAVEETVADMQLQDTDPCRRKQKICLGQSIQKLQI